MIVITHREMMATERLITEITDDIMRDVMTSVTSQESWRLAADFHLTEVVQRLDMLQQCSDVVVMSRIRSYFAVWKTQLSGKIWVTIVSFINFSHSAGIF